MALVNLDFANSPQFAVDEDILLLIDTDYGRLVPDGQKLASGQDGVIPITDPFTLTSSAVDFAALGVAPGRVVRLTSQPGTATGKLFTQAFGSEEYAVVAAVSGRTLSLRRPGMTAGDPGLSYAPTGVTLAGVYFLIATFDPQLRRATDSARDAIRRYVADADAAARLTDALLRDLTTDTALVPLYRNAIVETSAGVYGSDPYSRKMAATEAERDRLMADALSLARGGDVIIVA
jgi:hypothetical protein